MTHSRDTCESASCTVCYPQPFSSQPLARRSGQAPRPVTGPGGDNPINDEQIRELRDETTARIQALTSGPNAYDVNVRLNNLKRHCSVALGERRARPGGSRAASRAFVVTAYNARHAGKEG